MAVVRMGDFVIAARLCLISDLHMSKDPDRINKIVDKSKRLHHRTFRGFFQTTHASDLPEKIANFIEDNHKRFNAIVCLGDTAATGFSERSGLCAFISKRLTPFGNPNVAKHDGAI